MLKLIHIKMIFVLFVEHTTLFKNDEIGETEKFTYLGSVHVIKYYSE